MKKIILIGGGGHCKSCIDIIECTSSYKILGIIDLEKKLKHSILGYPIIGTDDDILNLSPKTDFFFITLGHIGFNSRRKELFSYLQYHQLPIATIISPTAILARTAQVGIGTIIMHHGIINADANIHENCIINSKALIEHDVTVGSHCHISTGSIINGASTIGDSSFIGSHSTINFGLSIPSNTIIASSSLVSKSIVQPGTYKGVPVARYE